MDTPSVNRVVTRIAARPILRTQPDERLAKLAQAGHAAAFEAIVQRYRRPLLTYCRRLLADNRAEDAVQQTFLAAYRALPDAGEVHLRAWLYRIAHNAAVDVIRNPDWGHLALDAHIDGVERPDQAVLRRERFDEVIAAVRELPERQRDAIVLRELEGRSHDEIAAALGVGRGAARQLIARARSTVRKAAAAVIPAWLPERLLAAPGGSGPRIAEVAAGGAFAAGATKAGVAALATGAIVAGGVSLPVQPRNDDRATASAPSRTGGETERRTVSSARSSSATPALEVETVARPRDDRHGSPDDAGSERQGHSGRGQGEGDERDSPHEAEPDDAPDPVGADDPAAEPEHEAETPEPEEQPDADEAPDEPAPVDSEALAEHPQQQLDAGSSESE